MHLKVIKKKSSKSNLIEFLNHQEFKCRCQYKDCTFTLVNQKLLWKFFEFRNAMGFSLEVTSGFRCQRHNQAVGGNSKSFHMKGSAIDLTTKYIKIEELYRFAKEYFDVVILYKDKNFIHCHMED